MGKQLIVSAGQPCEFVSYQWRSVKLGWSNEESFWCFSSLTVCREAAMNSQSRTCLMGDRVRKVPSALPEQRLGKVALFSEVFSLSRRAPVDFTAWQGEDDRKQGFGEGKPMGWSLKRPRPFSWVIVCLPEARASGKSPSAVILYACVLFSSLLIRGSGSLC